MSREPSVSVGLPVHNGERYLKQCVDSILSQSFEDLELVISDNASTDATESICREYAAADPRVRYVRLRQNTGAIFNFNNVFRLSRGRYFKWAAVDDVCLPEFVERCVEALDQDATIVLAHSKTAGIDEDGGPARAELIPGPGRDRVDFTYSNIDGSLSTSSPDPVKRFRRMMQDFWFTNQLYAVMRSDGLSHTGLHPYHYMGDHILLSELALHGRFYEVQETLFLRRIHAGQASGVAGPQQRMRVTSPRWADQRVPRWRMALVYPDRIRLHLASIARAPLQPHQRRQCYLAVANATVQWGVARGRQVAAKLTSG